MERTKDLAAEGQERESIDSKYDLETARPAPKVTKMMAISLDLHLQLLKYLGQSAGATNLVVSLSQADLIDVTHHN